MRTVSTRYKPKRVEFVSRKSLKRPSKKPRYRTVRKKNDANNHQSLLVHTLMDEELCSKPASMHQALSRVKRQKPWICIKHSSDPDLNYITKKVLYVHPPELIDRSQGKLAADKYSDHNSLSTSVDDCQPFSAKFGSRKRSRVYPSEKQGAKCSVSDAVADMTNVKSRKNL